jgi:hypothetical protein
MAHEQRPRQPLADPPRRLDQPAGAAALFSNALIYLSEDCDTTGIAAAEVSSLIGDQPPPSALYN